MTIQFLISLMPLILRWEKLEVMLALIASFMSSVLAFTVKVMWGIWTGWIFILALLVFLTLAFNNVEAYTIRFRELRADFIATIRLGNPSIYKSAIRKITGVVERATGGPLSALCFASRRDDKQKEGGKLTLKGLLKPKLRDILWFQENIHPTRT